MKFFILALLSLNAMADENAEKGVMFQQAKTNLISNFDAGMTNLNNAKNCVNKAADGAALKVCLEELSKANRLLKNMKKTQRLELKAKRDELKAKRK